MARLEHLDGFRFLAQMWILASENLFIGWKPLWMRRPDAAVSLFIALSGFCTHIGYSQRISTKMDAARTTFPFWTRRLLKTAFLYYLALSICIILKVSPSLLFSLYTFCYVTRNAPYAAGLLCVCFRPCSYSIQLFQVDYLRTASRIRGLPSCIPTAQVICTRCYHP